MRRLFIVPIGLAVLLVVGFIIGFAGQAPFFFMVSIVCTAPMFLVATGFAIGKASNRYTFFVPKQEVQVQYQQPSQPVPRRQRPAATYEVQGGDIRGN